MDFPEKASLEFALIPTGPSLLLVASAILFDCWMIAAFLRSGA